MCGKYKKCAANTTSAKQIDKRTAPRCDANRETCCKQRRNDNGSVSRGQLKVMDTAATGDTKTSNTSYKFGSTQGSATRGSGAECGSPAPLCVCLCLCSDPAHSLRRWGKMSILIVKVSYPCTLWKIHCITNRGLLVSTVYSVSHARRHAG